MDSNKGEYKFPLVSPSELADVTMPYLAYLGGTEKPKTPRKRAPWVYKSQYDNLQRKYTILCYIAWGLLIAFLITLTIAIG